MYTFCPSEEIKRDGETKTPTVFASECRFEPNPQHWENFTGQPYELHGNRDKCDAQFILTTHQRMTCLIDKTSDQKYLANAAVLVLTVWQNLVITARLA